jgi:hypothetical protein
MRGLLLALLLANIIYVGLTLLIKPGAPDDEQVPTKREGDSVVRLISEVDSAQLIEYPPSVRTLGDGQLSAERSQSVVPLPRPYCAQVGEFENLEDANDFITVNAIKMRVALDVHQLAASPQYRVYLSPFEGREEAVDAIEQLRATLVANKVAIESFLIAQGELANGIALGLFSEQANAMNVKSQIQKIGYEALIQEVQSTQKELNVTIREVESEAIFKEYWAEIQRKRPYLRAVEKLCETIAQGIQFP